jgi:hypothetical protein
VGRDPQRRGGGRQDGGIKGQPAEDLLRLEWRHEEWRAGYYRIQGPTVVIEYAPQQGDLDHIHTIYRDPTNDYGAKHVGR